MTASSSLIFAELVDMQPALDFEISVAVVAEVDSSWSRDEVLDDSDDSGFCVRRLYLCRRDSAGVRGRIAWIWDGSVNSEFGLLPINYFP